MFWNIRLEHVNDWHLKRFWEDVFLSHFSNGKVFLIQFWRGSLILSASEKTVFYWLNLFSLVNLVIYGSSQVIWDQSNGLFRV